MPLIHVDTLDDARLDAYARLTEAQLRSKLEPERALFIAESGKVIERAFEGGMEPYSLLMEEKWLASMEPLIARMEESFPALPVFIAPHHELAQLTGFELTRGALGAFRRPALPSVEEVVRDARLVAVLENITNHTNVGAIFRSAAAIGVDAVLVSPACYDPLYRRAVRVSMGTVFQVPWTRIGEEADAGAGASLSAAANAGAEASASSSADAGAGASLSAAAGAGAEASTSTRKRAKGRPGQPSAAWAREGIPLLRRLGFTTAAMALSDDSVSLDDERLARVDKLALVFGTEGDGLAHETIAQCDYTVRIPMKHDVDSLNVAAASAVAFWQFRHLCR